MARAHGRWANDVGEQVHCWRRTRPSYRCKGGGKHVAKGRPTLSRVRPRGFRFWSLADSILLLLLFHIPPLLISTPFLFWRHWPAGGLPARYPRDLPLRPPSPHFFVSSIVCGHMCVIVVVFLLLLLPNYYYEPIITAYIIMKKKRRGVRSISQMIHLSQPDHESQV